MRIKIAAVLVLAALPVFAQERTSDPRLAGPAIQALQSLLALREAEVKVIAEDAQKRIAELEQLCGEPCKPKSTEPPNAEAVPPQDPKAGKVK